MRGIPAHPEPIGDRWVDRIVRGVAGVFGQLFPDRIRGCYLRGSRASGTSTAGSDIDMFVVFKDSFVERAEARRAGEAAGYCNLLSSTPLEIIPVSEQLLQRADNLVVALQLKLASRLVHGEDIRRELPDMDTDAYVRAVAETPYHSYRHPRPATRRPRARLSAASHRSSARKARRLRTIASFSERRSRCRCSPVRTVGMMEIPAPAPEPPHRRQLAR